MSDQTNGGDQPPPTTDASATFWGTNVLTIVTGASKGIGRAISLGFARSFAETSRHRQQQQNSTGAGGGDGPRPTPRMSFVLLSRDQQALSGIDALLRALDPFISATIIIPGSLDEAKTVQNFENIIDGLSSTKFNQVIIVHNAGSLGNPRQLTNEFNSDDFRTLSLYFDLNVTSVISMTGSFLRAFHDVPNRVLVNISSLAGVQAMKGLNVYGAGKAARDAFFRSVALENPDVRVLNYAPGPVKTDMAHKLRRNSFLQEFFENEQNILAPERTVNRLIRILDENRFENGAHVDYFDNDEEA